MNFLTIAFPQPSFRVLQFWVCEVACGIMNVLLNYFKAIAASHSRKITLHKSDFVSFCWIFIFPEMLFHHEIAKSVNVFFEEKVHHCVHNVNGNETAIYVEYSGVLSKMVWGNYCWFLCYRWSLLWELFFEGFQSNIKAFPIQKVPTLQTTLKNHFHIIIYKKHSSQIAKSCLPLTYHSYNKNPHENNGFPGKYIEKKKRREISFFPFAVEFFKAPKKIVEVFPWKNKQWEDYA